MRRGETIQEGNYMCKSPVVGESMGHWREERKKSMRSVYREKWRVGKVWQKI